MHLLLLGGTDQPAIKLGPLVGIDAREHALKVVFPDIVSCRVHHPKAASPILNLFWDFADGGGIRFQGKRYVNWTVVQ